jgi:hypothetical protein
MAESMKKENFQRLKESVVEAGKVIRGQVAPSREFVYEIDSTDTPPAAAAEIWAVCVATDDDELLIRGKIYRVKIASDAVLVRDEDDEPTLCPRDFFIPIQLSREVEQRLLNLAEAA